MPIFLYFWFYWSSWATYRHEQLWKRYWDFGWQFYVFFFPVAWGSIWTLATATQFLSHVWIFEMYQWAIMMAALGTIFALSAPVCLLLSWTSSERPLMGDMTWGYKHGN